MQTSANIKHMLGHLIDRTIGTTKYAGIEATGGIYAAIESLKKDIGSCGQISMWRSKTRSGYCACISDIGFATELSGDKYFCSLLFAHGRSKIEALQALFKYLLNSNLKTDTVTKDHFKTYLYINDNVVVPIKYTPQTLFRQMIAVVPPPKNAPTP